MTNIQIAKFNETLASRAEYFRKQAEQELPDVEKIDFSDLNEAMANMENTIAEIKNVLKGQNNGTQI
jgi:hypothetical protein